MKKTFEITIYFYEGNKKTFIKKTIETHCNKYLERKMNFYQNFYKSDLVISQKISA